jgi:hypothetical protein
MQRLQHCTCTYQQPGCSPFCLRIFTSKRLCLRAAPPDGGSSFAILVYATAQHSLLALANGRAGVAVRDQEDNEDPLQEARVPLFFPAAASHQPSQRGAQLPQRVRPNAKI